MAILFQRIILLMVYMTCVYGDYTIVTRIHSYSNPTHAGQNHHSSTCCDCFRDSDGSCIDIIDGACDNRFAFCLKLLEDTTNGTNSCVSDILMSQINYNDAPIDFTEPRWLGLDNPLRLNGVNTAWQGAEIYIEVHDRDGTILGNEFYFLIDQWKLNIRPSNFTAGFTNFSAPLVYPGVHGFGFLELGIKIECVQFYDGTFCENFNECLSQSVNCNHGTCVDGEGFATCACDPGYTGERCEVDIDDCASVNCSSNGVCVDSLNSFSCHCKSGFTGELCNVEEQGKQIAAATGGVIGGVVVILVFIVLTAVITAAIVRKKVKTNERLQQNISYEVSAQKVEPQASYEFTDPAASNRPTDDTNGIEMKPNEVYSLRPHDDITEDFEMSNNEVYNL